MFQIKKERDVLYKKMFEGSLIVAQKNILKEMICQKKVADLKEQVESREAAIQELVSKHSQPQGIIRKYEVFLINITFHFHKITACIHS